MNSAPQTARKVAPETARASKPTQRMMIIVLPIFNEETNLAPLFDRIKALQQETTLYRIIAVNDGSTDRSGEILDSYCSQLPLGVIQHKVNQGLGVALRSGLMDALRGASADDVIITMDADESHTPSLIGRMLTAIEPDFDVVIASRFRPGSEVHGVPLHRWALSIGAAAIFRTLFPTRGVRDFTCGYRAYRVSALLRATDKFGTSLFEFDGFQCMVDILLKLRASGAKFTEVPMVLRYDLKKGQSKMRILQTVQRTLRLVVSRRFGM